MINKNAKRTIDLYFIFMMTIAIMSMAALTLVLSGGQAHAIGLKSNSIIEGHDITLGDVFYDLERDSDRVLGAAPRPGKDMVLNARTLMRIAVALDLPWRPTSSAYQVVLRRSATVINDKMLEAGIFSALKERDLPGHFEIELPAQTRHIETIKMRSSRINSGTILSAADLVGMTPRRMVLDGKPIVANDVEAPRIVKRGESVTLNFKSGSLELSAMGKALEHGSKGDLVRVVNNSSNRTIEALVTGEREVTVQTF